MLSVFLFGHAQSRPGQKLLFPVLTTTTRHRTSTSTRWHFAYAAMLS